MNFKPLNLNLGLNRNLQRIFQRIKIVIMNKIKMERTLSSRHPSPVIP
jgi:hypothetical protein